MEVVFPETNMQNNAISMLSGKKRRFSAHSTAPKRQKCSYRVLEKPKIIEEIIRHNAMKERLEAIHNRFYFYY